MDSDIHVYMDSRGGPTGVVQLKQLAFDYTQQ